MGTVEPQVAHSGAVQEVTDGFHLVIDGLKLNGIDTIFGLPGIPITDFTRMAQAAGMRVISFRHEQNAGNAAAIAGFMTQKPGICLTVSAPGFLNGLTALANATTNCFPMILISGSSEREIVDLQQGDYEEMDQLNAAKPYAKAAYRVLHAEDIGIGVARGIPAAVSGRPGGVYLDLPAKLLAQTLGAVKAQTALGQVVDATPRELRGAEAVERANDDIGSCVAALRAGLDAGFAKPSAEWTGAIAERKSKNLAKMAATLDKNPSPMNFHSALRAIRDVLKTRPDINVVNEGANTLDYARSIIDMYEPRKRFDSGTWGIMGIGMSFAIGAAVTSGKPDVAVEGDSAFGFSGMELETICRYDLPVCTIVFNNNGVYRGTDVNPTGGKDVAPTLFVKNARYDKMIEAFGGIGRNATTPEELTKSLVEAVASGKPTLSKPR